jgi:hypothetical protein
LLKGVWTLLHSEKSSGLPATGLGHSMGEGASRLTPDLHLTIRNYGGSVEHFHHFLFGFLVPLVCHAKSSWQNPRYHAVLIRSCGPMDGIIRQLKSGRLRTIDKAEHARLGEGRPRFGSVLRGLAFGSGDRRFMDLKGYDYPVVYNARAFARARAGLNEILGAEIANVCAALEQRFPPGAPRIIAIDRGAADPFYLSANSEAKQAGAGRRSVPNHAEIVEELTRRLGFVLSLKLEGLPLAEQMALFASADLVVAQHGAALSNLLWSRPGTAVVEIMPRTMPQEIQDIGFFSNLAPCLKLRHRFVGQEHDHASVDPAAVADAAAQILSTRRDRKAG